MSNKQKKLSDRMPKNPPVGYKKWLYTPSRLSPKIEANTAPKHMHDRMLFLIINFVGRIISVSLKNGIRYKGILGAVNTDSDMGLVLKMATPVDTVHPDNSDQPNGLEHRIIDELIILPRDLMQIQVEHINFNESVQTEQKFQTDSEISGKFEIKEKELHKWVPSNNEAADFGLLEDLSQPLSNGEVWDQFEANEKLFGVKSEFDEDLYTTKVDKSHPSYKQREAEAARIAQEIQQSSTNNIHVAEERGFIQTDVSEETMYSGVFRPTPQNNTTSDNLKETESASVTVVPSENSTIIPSEASKPEADVSKEDSSTMPTLAIDEQKSEPSTSNSTCATKTPKIETELMGTFKQFVSGERERLQAKKQALFKKEKYVKLQELLKFSQNFKLNTHVPPDLVPIISKDKTKQNEASTKSTTATSKSLTPPSNNSTQSPKQAQTLPNPSQQTSDPLPSSQNAEKAPQKVNMKLNVKASVFKPNSMSAYTQHTPKMEGQFLDVSTFQQHHAKVSTPLDFFNNKKPEFSERGLILKKFDPFKRYRLEHPNNEHSSEKPYSFIPTWPYGDKSYKEKLHELQQTLNFPQPGQVLYDCNEDYRFPYIDPNSLNFITVPYSPSPFYTTQQDALYGGIYNTYRNFVPTQAIQPAYSLPGHLVKLLYMTPNIVQNMAYHPQHNIYIPSQVLNPQGYNSQTGQPVFGYPGSRNTPMMMQFHPGVQGQAGLQQTVMMTVPTGMNKTVQGQTYGYSE